MSVRTILSSQEHPPLEWVLSLVTRYHSLFESSSIIIVMMLVKAQVAVYGVFLELKEDQLCFTPIIMQSVLEM